MIDITVTGFVRELGEYQWLLRGTDPQGYSVHFHVWKTQAEAMLSTLESGEEVTAEVEDYLVIPVSTRQ